MPTCYNREVKGWINNKVTHELVNITLHGYTRSSTMENDEIEGTFEVVGITPPPMPYKIAEVTDGASTPSFYVDCNQPLICGQQYYMSVHMDSMGYASATVL